MKGTVHFVLNEGEIVFASNNQEAVENYAVNKCDDAILEEAEDRGIDADDLDDDELGELAFMAGYNGGCYITDSIEIPADMDLDDTFEDCEGSTHTFGDLDDVYSDIDEDELY